MLKKLRSAVVVFSLLSFLILSFLGLQFFRFVQKPLPVGNSGNNNGTVLVIAPGTPVHKIADQLLKEGILNSTWAFLTWVKWQGAWYSLKAGEYLIKPGTTPTELIQQLRDGRVIQHVLTIVPGWSFQRLIEMVNQEPSIAHTCAGLKSEDIMIKLGHVGEHPEGRFFAETYYFPAGTSDIAFLKRAYNLLQDKMNGIWENRAKNLPLKSAYEALILASIIEKESSVIDEYSEIAGVYIRRLEKNMPLQADPTVVYGAGKEFGTPISKEMLNTETPYNTYKISGLPPTPIAFPSLKALEAAVHPKEGETLYFVADVDGKRHVFSKTLEEHQVAVARYRKANNAEGSE